MHNQEAKGNVTVSFLFRIAPRCALMLGWTGQLSDEIPIGFRRFSERPFRSKLQYEQMIRFRGRKRRSEPCESVARAVTKKNPNPSMNGFTTWCNH